MRIAETPTKVVFGAAMLVLGQTCEEQTRDIATEAPYDFECSVDDDC